MLTKQIQTVLSRSAWDTVTIVENGEPLMLLSEFDNLRYAQGLKPYQPLFYVRETLGMKIIKAADSLPIGYVLLIIEGVRTMQSQQEEWDNLFLEIKKLTSLSDEEVARKVRMLVAPPHPLANHHCGGAVDVTLGYVHQGELQLVDMGTPYISQIKDFSVHAENIKMLAENIPDLAKFHRKLLREAMEKQGFVWYPGEWWHYCYGDRMWAVYTQQTECFYGSIENSYPKW